jgi:hypothetical protein
MFSRISGGNLHKIDWTLLADIVGEDEERRGMEDQRRDGEVEFYLSRTGT